MNSISAPWSSVKQTNVRKLVTQALSIGTMLATALIIWNVLICVTGSEAPVTVVVSGSMEPAFRRGDMIFSHMSNSPIRVGEIVIYRVGESPNIVHRVIEVHERKGTGEVDLLTKGDNNIGDDRVLYARYAPGQQWLQRRHIIGRVVGFLPYVGWPTIIRTELPFVKTQVHRLWSS